MELSKALNIAIKNNDIISIRSCFFTMAHEDPSFGNGKFLDSFNQVKMMDIEGFIDEHRGVLDLNKENWNEVYWAKVTSDIIENFSYERINHLMDVGNKVYSTNKSTVRKSTNMNNHQFSINESLINNDEKEKYIKLILVFLWGLYFLYRVVKKGKK